MSSNIVILNCDSYICKVARLFPRATHYLIKVKLCACLHTHAQRTRDGDNEPQFQMEYILVTWEQGHEEVNTPLQS